MARNRRGGFVSVEIEYSRGMRRLLDGGWINGHTLGFIAGEVLKDTVGPGKIQQDHFNTGQARWPRLAASTKRDKDKKSSRIFYHSGRSFKAITQSVSGGKVRQWGSSADIYATGNQRQRFTGNGLYASMSTRGDSVTLTIGFNGTLKHSKEFKRARKMLAAERGIDISGRSSKRIKAAVSVKDTTAFMRSRGITGRKFAAMGALGIEGRRHKLARGKDNLAYANIVQAGPFAGIRDNDTGLHYTPHEVPKSKQQIGNNYSEVRGKQPRPLLPYQAGDTSAIQAAIERAAQKVLDQIGL